MRIDDDLLAILACPACHAPLRVDAARSDEARPGVGAEPTWELVCTGCLLAYPVRDDIPVLLVDEARTPERPPEPPEPADGA